MLDLQFETYTHKRFTESGVVEEPIRVSVIRNKRLMKRQMVVELFNLHPSSLDRMVKDGHIRKYHANGVVKTDSAKTGVFYDLNEIMNYGTQKKAVKVATLPRLHKTQ